MGKDRLAELQATSKHVKKSDIENSEEEMVPLKKQDKAMSNSQENFFDMLQEVTSAIDTVQTNVTEVDRLQKKILNAVHPDTGDQARLSDLHNTNKKLAQKIRTALKSEHDKLEKLSSPKKKQSKARQETDIRCRQTQVSAQTTRFYNIWNAYNESQLSYREKSKKILVKQCKITGNTDLSNEQIEEMLDEGKTGNMFATSILDQERLARQQLMDLQERHGEFLKLEKQIEEVRDMFMEIAALVQSQGEMVDNIFQNVTKAGIDVEQGKQHLDQAEKHMKSAMKKKFICAVIAIIVIIIILLVVLIEFGAFSSSSPSSSYVPSSTHLPETPTTSQITSFSSAAGGSAVTEPSFEVPETVP